MSRLVLAFEHFIGEAELQTATAKLYQYAVDKGIQLIGLPGPVVCDGSMHRIQLVERTLENGTAQIHLEVL